MKRLRWMVPMLLSIVTLFTVLSSAGFSQDVTYWWRYGTTLEDEARFVSGVAEKYGLDIEFLMPGGEYYQAAKVAHAAGTGPDLFIVTTLTAPEFQEAGLTQDLSPFFERDVNPNDIFMPTVEQGRYPPGSGPLVAVPINVVVGVLFYNKDLFDAAGVAYPDASWSWEDLRRASEQLTRQVGADASNKVYGFGVDNAYYTYLHPAIRANGGDILSADRKRSAINNPVAEETLRFFKEMIDQGIAARPAMVGGDMMLSNRVAMVATGMWMAGPYSEAGINYGMVVLPEGSERRVTYGASDMIAMSSNAKNPEAAWKVLYENMVGRSEEYYQATSWMPIYRELVGSPRLALLFEERGLDLPVLIESIQYMENTASLNWSNWYGEVAGLTTQVLEGAIPITTGLENMERAMNRWLQDRPE